MIKIVCKMAIAILLLVTTGSASSAQKLQIGDTLPDLQLQNVIFNEKTSFLTSDYREKLLIFYFWSPNCLSCLRHFDELDSIQKKYQQKVQFVLVCSESGESIIKFFALRKKLKRPDVLFVTNDTTLHKILPFPGNSFFVWVDQGVMKYHTFIVPRDDVISAYFKGEMVRIVNEGETKYSRTPIDSMWLRSAVYYSFFSKCIPEVAFSAPIKSGPPTLSFSCTSILELYKTAYNGLFNLKYQLSRPGRVIYEGPDSATYLRPKDAFEREMWYRRSAYTYQIRVDTNQKKNIYKYMCQDLQRMVGLYGRIEKRLVRTLCLVRTSTENKIRSAGGALHDNFVGGGLKTGRFDSLRTFQNVPFPLLETRLRGMVEGTMMLPFADLTGFTENIDISFPGEALDYLDVERLRKAFGRYDLDLVFRDLPTDVLVVKKVEESREQ